MVVYCRKNGRIKGKAGAVLVNRLGLTVSTKLGNAVRRNRIRRRLREIYRLSEEKLSRGYDIVIVARASAHDAPFSSLQGEFRKNCHRLGLIRDRKDLPVRRSPEGGGTDENRSAEGD